jgi:hypothetical protein
MPYRDKGGRYTLDQEAYDRAARAVVETAYQPKGTAPMPMVSKAKADQTVAREADAFETSLKSARVPDTLHDGLWDMWVDNPERATRIVQAFAPAAKTKAAPAPPPHPIDALAMQLVTTLRAKMGDEQVMQWLQEQIRTATGAKPAAKAAQKPATKTETLTPLQQVARATMPELYDIKKGS